MDFYQHLTEIYVASDSLFVHDSLQGGDGITSPAYVADHTVGFP